jgi:hypothetical protein
VLVEGLPLFIESKMVERLNVVAAMEKAVEQSRGQTPLLFHRKKRTDWLVTIRLSDLQEVAQIVSLSCTRPGPSDTASTFDTTSCPPRDLPGQQRLWQEGQ